MNPTRIRKGHYGAGHASVGRSYRAFRTVDGRVDD